ncbi:hypothetical protein ACFE04_008554 [Oxalis oulophora]
MAYSSLISFSLCIWFSFMAIMLSLSKLSANWKINSEAGVTEIWIRRWNTLPSFNNAPQLMYVEEVFMERHSQVVPRHSNHHHNNLINIREANHLEMSTKKFEDFVKVMSSLCSRSLSLDLQ